MEIVTWLHDGEEIDFTDDNINSTFVYRQFLSDPFQSVYHQILEVTNTENITGLFSCEVSSADGTTAIRNLMINRKLIFRSFRHL